MKIKAAALAILILLAAGGLVQAKKSPSRPFFLQLPVTIDGAEVPPGVYDLTLESTNSGVRLTLWKYGHFVATARGAWVKSGMKYTETSVLLRVNSDGSRSLIEIRLAGTAKTIVLDRSETVLQLSAK